MDFSWIKGTIRGWTVLAWWVVLPIRAVAMILSIAADLIFISIFGIIAAFWFGMIPDATVRTTLDQVGHKIESYVMPEFKAALHPAAMTPSITTSSSVDSSLHAGGGNAATDALMATNPGAVAAQSVRSGR